MAETGREAGANLRWLTGFSGSSGLAVLGTEDYLTKRYGFGVASPSAERSEPEAVGSNVSGDQ